MTEQLGAHLPLGAHHKVQVLAWLGCEALEGLGSVMLSPTKMRATLHAWSNFTLRL